jgi:uncharacterized protein YeaO (DUF488 family)
LAGFTKRDDLKYFVRVINGIDYHHLPILAPSQEILDSYKKNGGDWSSYERQFLSLLKERKIEEKVSKMLMDGACLLCSESTPENCHRRLVAEYLRRHWEEVEIMHL